MSTEAAPVSSPAESAPAPVANPEAVASPEADPSAGVAEPTPSEVIEPQIDPEVETRKREEDFSKRFAALSRKERDFLNRERQVKDREAQLHEAETKLKNLKDNPIEALQAAGWTFKELAEFVVNNNQLPETKKQQSTFEKLQAKIDELEKKLSTREEAETSEAQQKNIAAFKGNIREAVTGDLDKYGLINDFGDEAIEMVYDVIENHFNNTFDPDSNQGEILDIHTAAEAVEKHLVQQGERFFKSNRFASRLRPQEQERAPESHGATSAKPTPSPTLTHRQTVSATPPKESERYLSDEESKQAAAKFLKEQLANQQA